MSAQHDHALFDAPAPPPGPAAAAQLLAQIQAGRRADTWGPAFERDWGKALEASRVSYSLTPLHDVVRAWQLKLASAPAVDAFFDGGCDDTEFVALHDVLGPRR